MFNKLLVFGAIAVGTVVGLVAPDGAKQPATVPVASAPTAPATPVPSYAPMVQSTVVLDRASNGHFYADAMVNGQLVRFMVDTGASGVALTARDAHNVGLQFMPGEFQVIGRGASGDVMGKPVTLDRVAIGGKEALGVSGVVVGEGLDISLLGQSFLSRIGSVEIRQDQMTLK